MVIYPLRGESRVFYIRLLAVVGQPFAFGQFHVGKYSAVDKSIACAIKNLKKFMD